MGWGRGEGEGRHRSVQPPSDGRVVIIVICESLSAPFHEVSPSGRSKSTFHMHTAACLGANWTLE